jgi:ATP-binding cassette, subfamily B, bacterial
MKRIKIYKQYDEMDCGPACLKMAAHFYGKNYSMAYLRNLAMTNRGGTNMFNLSKAATQIGFATQGLKIDIESLATDIQLPCIAFWEKKHFVIIEKITSTHIFIADPAMGKVKLTINEFTNKWYNDDFGIILTLIPSNTFEQNLVPKKTKIDIDFFKKHLTHHAKKIGYIIICLLCISVFQIMIPLLTQQVVDKGIRFKDMSFIHLIMFAQFAMLLGRIFFEVIRNIVLLKLSNTLNINLLTDFFTKLLKLPLGFFDNKKLGDILQRINNHRRIESFLTQNALGSIFSIVSIIVLSILLAWYNIMLFIIFLVGSILYVVWITSFMKKRALLDTQLFSQQAEAHEKNYELILGMQEIKLQNAQVYKQNDWRSIQEKLYALSLKGLVIRQWQVNGATIINELKNIIITLIVAKLVSNGQLSFGIMLSITYILGQLNTPINQLIELIQGLQDANLSMSRIDEIHKLENEAEAPNNFLDNNPNIELKNISFSYDNTEAGTTVLYNLNCIIPANKVTAIVGSSGSGKTTLLKLLLKFYEPTKGSILVNGTHFAQIKNSYWRNICGVVMQDGYIFNDSIENNIAIGVNNIDEEKLKEAAKMANIKAFINGLPLTYKTKIGSTGMGLSAGQKQRILIARAIYKNPMILLFDEATSALDAKNEREITNNLGAFFKNRTVVIIAHRLSTVRNADNIIVLEQGSVKEQGTHTELIERRGDYYNLVSNQLEMVDR